MLEDKKYATCGAPIESFVDGVTVALVRHNGKYFSLFQIKNGFLCCASLGASTKTSDSIRTSTRGTVVIGHTPGTTPGIEFTSFTTFGKASIRRTAKVNYQEPLYCALYNDSTKDVFKKLFCLENLSKDKTYYTLRYNNNPTISALVAVELPEVTDINLQTKKDVLKFCHEFKSDLPNICTVHILLGRIIASWFNSNKINVKDNLFDEDVLMSLGSIPVLIGVGLGKNIK